MTLVKALETLKSKGIVKLTGLCGESNIEKYIDNARGSDENAADVLNRYPDMSWAIYHKEHADDHYIVETNGHHIIATKYDNFDMATYGDYDSDEEMYEAFKEWEIKRDAEAIADEMDAKRPGELPHAAWVLIATSELKAAHKASKEAFEREFGKAS
jgi:rubrerythrin